VDSRESESPLAKQLDELRPCCLELFGCCQRIAFLPLSLLIKETWGAGESPAASAAGGRRSWRRRKERIGRLGRGRLARRADVGWRGREVIGWASYPRSGAVIMHARDPAEAVEVLNVLLKFFGDGERWIKGRFSDRRGNCCLVGALDFVTGHHAIKGDAAEPVSGRCHFRGEGRARSV
jgi:hypothetical protein